jgi:hypothetical protein
VIADKHQAFDHGFPLWQLALGFRVMNCPASRSVTNGFQPGSLTGP